MGVKHTYVSAVADDPAAVTAGQVTPTRWNDLHTVDADGITMPASTVTPATPAGGNVTLFGRTFAGGALPAYAGPSGLYSMLQPFMGRSKVGVWQPLGNTNSAPISSVGIGPISFLGTATSRNVATTNLLTSTRRIGVVSATTANSRAGANSTPVQFWRGNAVGCGGFRAVFRWGCSDAATVASARTFVGFSSTSSMTSAEPSSVVNMVGVGTDGVDANLCIMHNDGAGVATKIDLGPDFPDHTLSADLYELALFAPSNGASIGWEVARINRPDIAPAQGVITTDLPVNTVLMLPIFARSNNASTLAVGLDIVSLYIETEN